MQNTERTSPLGAPLQSKEEAVTLAQALEDILARLSAVLDAETSLAKAGKLRDAIDMQPEKARLTESFIKTAERFRSNSNYFRMEFPEMVEKFQKLHEKFHNIVSRNMTALATAKALSESLIQEVVDSVHEFEQPSGYTKSGKAPSEKPAGVPPLKLNISL